MKFIIIFIIANINLCMRFEENKNQEDAHHQRRVLPGLFSKLSQFFFSSQNSDEIRDKWNSHQLWTQETNWSNMYLNMIEAQDKDTSDGLTYQMLNLVVENYAGLIQIECIKMVNKSESSAGYGSLKKKQEDLYKLDIMIQKLEKKVLGNESKGKDEKSIKNIQETLAKYKYLFDELKQKHNQALEERAITLGFCINYYQYIIKNAPTSKYFLSSRETLGKYRIYKSYTSFTPEEKRLFQYFLLDWQKNLDNNQRITDLDLTYQIQFYLTKQLYSKMFVVNVDPNEVD